MAIETEAPHRPTQWMARGFAISAGVAARSSIRSNHTIPYIDDWNYYGR
jgi:hypothetical protein